MRKKTTCSQASILKLGTKRQNETCNHGSDEAKRFRDNGQQDTN